MSEFGSASDSSGSPLDGERHHQVGETLPSDRRRVRDWVGRQLLRDKGEPLHPSMMAFKCAVEEDPVLFMLAHMMFEVTILLCV